MQSALATAEARNTFVLELKRGGRATFKDVKLALALLFQSRADSLAPAFAAYASLVEGEVEVDDATLAAALAAGLARRCLNVEVRIKPEFREAFLASIAVNERGTHLEPLNLWYSWGESEANVFLFQEQFVGEAGFKAHAAAPHFQAWEDFVATDPFLEPPSVRFFDAQSNLAAETSPSVIAAAVLASLGFIEGGF